MYKSEEDRVIQDSLAGAFCAGVRCNLNHVSLREILDRWGKSEQHCYSSIFVLESADRPTRGAPILSKV